MDLVIEGNAYINGDIVKCCIGVERGKIRTIKKVLKGDKHHDFGEKLVLPGGIDAHVHFRDPGMTHKEDFATGTTSAAYGGISCVLDMPNTFPPTTNMAAFQEKAGIASAKAFVDFGLFAGVNMKGEIEGLSRTAIAFKIYLATTTGDMLMDDYDALPDIFQQLSRTKRKVCVHCEDEALIDKSFRPNSLSGYLKSRPNDCEVSGLERVISSRDDANVHICHVSTAEGVKLIENSELTSELTPHHLLLSSSSKLGALGKVNPPLRKTEDQRALWDALNRGTIDIIASDHAPHTLEEKEPFEEALSGVPGTETMLPIMLSLMKHGKFDLKRLVNAVSERPGEIFNLNKGKIEIGYDADIIAVDLRKEVEIRGKNLHTKCGWTPFEGFTAVFPKFTFVRGECVIEDWELTGERGFGKMMD